jgi:hypothetical protein
MAFVLPSRLPEETVVALGGCQLSNFCDDNMSSRIVSKCQVGFSYTEKTPTKQQEN